MSGWKSQQVGAGGYCFIATLILEQIVWFIPQGSECVRLETPDRLGQAYLTVSSGTVECVRLETGLDCFTNAIVVRLETPDRLGQAYLTVSSGTVECVRFPTGSKDEFLLFKC